MLFISLHYIYNATSDKDISLFGFMSNNNSVCYNSMLCYLY